MILKYTSKGCNNLKGICGVQVGNIHFFILTYVLVLSLCFPELTHLSLHFISFWKSWYKM